MNIRKQANQWIRTAATMPLIGDSLAILEIAYRLIYSMVWYLKQFSITELDH